MRRSNRLINKSLMICWSMSIINATNLVNDKAGQCQYSNNMSADAASLKKSVTLNATGLQPMIMFTILLRNRASMK
jgi:hypothetical protein